MTTSTGTLVGRFAIGVAKPEDTTPPTADISISQPSPMGAGAVNVSLTASELLQSASLTYTLQGKTAVTVPLTGSGTDWSGSFEIASKSGDGTALFSWSGTTTFEIDSTSQADSFEITIIIDKNTLKEILI